MPLMLVLPLAVPLLIVAGATRTRRGSALLSLLGFALGLIATAVVIAALTRRGPYAATYSWVNVPLSFTGAREFQTFAVDVSLHADRAAAVASAYLVGLTALAVQWTRSVARQEQSPPRLYGVLGLAAGAGVGVALSGDLLQLAFFWLLAGVASYLLLSHRWGVEQAARPASLSLAVAFGADLALVAAAALIQSHYGQTDIAKVVPVAHTVAGAGMKSLTAAAVLIVVAALGRAAAFPFQSWQTGPVLAPPAAVAYVTALWSVLPALLLFRTLPLIRVADPRAQTLLVAAGIAGAGVSAVLAVTGADARKVLIAAGGGFAALAAVATVKAAPGTGLDAALVIGAARLAALLALTGMITRMRTADLAEMAEGLRRMPWSSGSLAVAAAAAAGACVLAGAGLRSGRVYWPYAVAAGLLVVGFSRVHGASGYGRLWRRRAFEPARVREVLTRMWVAAALAVLAAAAAVPLLASSRWIGFLDGAGHRSPGLTASIAWLALGVAAMAVSLALFAPRRSPADPALRAGGLRLGLAAAAGSVYGSRLLRAGEAMISGVQARSGRAAAAAAGLAEESAAAVASVAAGWTGVAALVAAAIVMAAFAVAMATPGVTR